MAKRTVFGVAPVLFLRCQLREGPCVWMTGPSCQARSGEPMTLKGSGFL